MSLNNYSIQQYSLSDYTLPSTVPGVEKQTYLRLSPYLQVIPSSMEEISDNYSTMWQAQQLRFSQTIRRVIRREA